MKEDSWIAVDGSEDYIFHDKPSELWKTILREMGGIYAQMVHYPEHPSLN
jgi:putative transcriptional regulator